jgi:mannose-6-phosphate isomerase-like protein (cupin superfamily)
MYYENIEQLTIKNAMYRRVLYTTPEMQLVLMSLLPKQEIGMETHEHTTQFFRIEEGTGIAVVGDRTAILSNGTVVVVPPGTPHNIINTSTIRALKLYTIYSPAHHPDGLVQKNKPRSQD